MARIAHLTSVHHRNDTRIFLKMCRSLAAAGHEVLLVVADGAGDEERDGVRIVDIGRSQGRLARMLGATRRVLQRAKKLDADVYHLHDPELLPAGLALKRRGKRVVFDAHEDLPRQILSKHYLRPAVRGLVASLVGAFERFASRRLDHVVAATPAIRDKFAAMGVDVSNINNFPMPSELDAGMPWSGKHKEVCYVGGISSIRGIREVIAAIGVSRSGATLSLVGNFTENAVREEVRNLPGWDKTNEIGFLPRAGVRDILGRSVAGIVTFLPVPNHIEAQPNKMFEYMSAGLPVIASDFPLWREIVEGNECGLCVDPLDPAAIAAAIDRLVDDPELARRMGENGRRAVRERYNWHVEEEKLLALYRKLSPDA